MNWLVDTQLPYQLASALKKRGQVATHVSELPLGNQSTDTTITEYAEERSAILVTKDTDFHISHEVQGVPRRLVLVTTGNIRNRELLFLFMQYLDMICDNLDQGGLIELDRSGLIVR